MPKQNLGVVVHPCMHCDQCEMVSINGVPCHESGCPNRDARWNAAELCWVKQYECRECGGMTDVGDVCCTKGGA